MGRHHRLRRRQLVKTGQHLGPLAGKSQHDDKIAQLLPQSLVSLDG
jgi:hypothetical protein